jgi:hypothetical protein
MQIENLYTEGLNDKIMLDRRSKIVTMAYYGQILDASSSDLIDTEY